MGIAGALLLMTVAFVQFGLAPRASLYSALLPTLALMALGLAMYLKK